MEDPLKKHLAKLKAIKESTHRRAEMYSDLSKLDNNHTMRSLGALNKAPSPGKKFQKIGFIMLWIPEPTGITCAVGGPMIVAGRYLSKVYNDSKITDIGENTKNTISEIHNFKQSLL